LAALLSVANAAEPAPEEAPSPPAPILSTEISGSDLAFFTGAAREIAALTRLSALAKDRAVIPEVKAVADAIFNQQTDLGARLETLAASKQVPLAEELDGPGKAQLHSLDARKGPRFDKSFLDATSDAQDRLETSFEAGAGSSDKDIKAFAEAGLATLKQERDRVAKLGL
jgi:predicted outer membrane protein